MHKFGIIRGPADEDEPFVHPDLWEQEETTGPERMVIAPSKDHIGLMLELSRCLKGPFRLLYILLNTHRDHDLGRYLSPSLEAEGLRAFLDEFRGYLESDARHHLWVMSEARGGTIVYDNHNILYAYGPLEGYEEILRRRGLRPGNITLPAPHSHHYHTANDDWEDKLLARWEWVKSPLQDGDDD